MDGPTAPPPRPQIIVREVHRFGISSFWIVVLLGVVAAGYFLATDWAEKHHKALHTFSDYTDAFSSAWDDKEYKRNMAGRLQDFLQLPSCDVPLKWATTGYVGPCYLTLYQPARLYPGADTGVFITAAAGSVLKVAERSSTNADYAYAQSLKLNGGAIPTGATTADACMADHRCSALVSGLNTAGYKPATETPLPAAESASLFDGAYGCTKNADGNPEDHIVQLEQKTKSVRETIKYTSPLTCEFSFKDGIFGPLVASDTCNLPFPKTNVFQRVEFADDTVFFGFFETSSTGSLTSEQRAGSERFNLKTGIMEAVNGDRYQCRSLSRK